MKSEAEEKRLAWVSAVQRLSEATEALERSQGSDGGKNFADATAVSLAKERVERTHDEYAESMRDWIIDAPRHAGVLLAASTVALGEEVVPAISFAFQGGPESPVTVTLMCSEMDLRRFQNDLNKKITEALRDVRRISKGYL